MPPTVGKAYRLSADDPRAGVCLPGPDGRLCLVGWDQGRVRHHPVGARRGFSYEPDVITLCRGWGVTPAQLDAMTETLLYADAPDVHAVRGNPLRKA